VLPEEIPDCPEHLDDIAKQEWGRVAPILQAAGILKVTDRAVLAAYCDVYSRWVAATKQIKRFGTVMKTKSGYVAQSPYLNIVIGSLDQMRKLASELGLTPSSRSRLQVTPSAPPNPLQLLLDRRRQRAEARARPAN
jgi:P27 family predicted phage terminase small subunit